MRYTGSMRSRLLAALAIGASLASCGGGGNALPTGPSPVSTSVELLYEVTTAAASEALGCEGQVRVYPSWWGFAQVTMVPAAGNRFVLLFEDVPIGEQRLNVVASESCAGGSLVANGVRLADEAEAFTFTLHPDGRVTP